MRKILLAVFLTLSLTSWSEVEKIQKVADFDFHNYQTLTPAVDFGTEAVYEVKGRPFYSGDIKLEDNSPAGYWIVVNKHIQSNYAGLQFPSHSIMTISCNSDCELVKIDMTDFGFYDGTGGLSLHSSTNYGTYHFGVWEAKDSQDQDISNLHRISFVNNNGLDAFMSGIRVTYNCPADRLSYTLNHADGYEFDPFEGLTLTFPEEVTILEGTQFIVENSSNEQVATLTATVNGKQVTLAPDETITAPGSYTLRIARKSFITELGEYNKASQYAFSVKDHPDTFNPTAYSLKAGKVKQLDSPLILTFPGQIAAIEAGSNTVDLVAENGTPALQGVLSVSDSDDNQLLITFDASVSDLRGQYTLTIPENTIKCTDAFHYNKVITLTYNCVGYDVPTPELIEQATNLLARQGVGYPLANGTARTALAAVVNDESSTLQDYQQAIQDYVACTEIALPTIGSYYLFAKKASATAETQKYLAYAEGAFSASDDKADAHHFKVIDADGYRALQAADGTTYNVAFTKAVPATEETLGLINVAINGFTDEIEGIGYAVENTLSPDPASSFTLLPADGTKTDYFTEIVITINDVDAVTYHEEKPIQLLLNGEVANVITGIKVEDNVVTVTTDIHKFGVYTLNIPKGALTFYSIDHEVDVPAITATYNLSYDYAFRYDFFSSYVLSNNVSTSGVHKSEEMNDLILFTKRSVTSLFVNPEVCETNVYDNNSNHLFTGTLVSGEEVIDGVQCSTLTFKFNTLFTKENLPDGRYHFVIEKGSFGDKNFGAYLESPAPELKSSCHLNDRSVYSYTIDNTAAGISTVTVDNKQGVLYDLSGRKVAAGAAKGIYIVNGKKVVK